MLSTNALPVIFLTVAAVTRVHNQWRCGQRVPHRAAGASPFQIHLHPPHPTLSAYLAVVAVLCSKKTANACAKKYGKPRFLRPLEPNNSEQAGCFSLLPG
jgi:hypothetical protein